MHPKISITILCVLTHGRLLLDWVLVKGFSLSYHNKETMLFTLDPHYGTLNLEPSGFLLRLLRDLA